MSFEHIYSQNNLEFVKQVYLKQLHFAVFEALQEKQKNHKASSAYFNFGPFGKWRIGDFARGYHLDQAQAAPKPHELRAGQHINSSALMKTLEHMSYDRDFDGIADLVNEINNLQMSSDINAWSASIDSLAEKATQTIVGLRFADLKRVFKPGSALEANVATVIGDARKNYGALVRRREYPFSKSQQEAAKAKRNPVSKPTSTLERKSSSCCIFSCLNFFSRPKYQEVSGRDDSPSREPRQSSFSENIVATATKIFTQYFKTKGMKTAWSSNVSDDEVSKDLNAQNIAAKEVIALLNSVGTLAIEMTPITKIAELMYDATQRQGFGCFFRSSQFAKALKKVAVALAGTWSGDAQSVVKGLEEQESAMQLCHEKRQKKLQYSKDRYVVMKGLTHELTPEEKKCWRLTTKQQTEFGLTAYDKDESTPFQKAQARAYELPICQDDIKAAKAAIVDAKRQEGVNKCFSSILSAIKASKNHSENTPPELLVARESAPGRQVSI
jgi:hypothetical protein